MRVPADSGSCESSLPGLQKASLSLCPHLLRREDSVTGTPSLPSDYLPEAPPPNTVTLGIRVST